jgi:drug/metabolite transporter (DMT)-like permease
MVFKKKIWFHLLALVTVTLWGVTFVSTKVLIQNELSPIAIFLYRSIIAWICLVIIAPKRLLAYNLKDELWMVALGFFGGSLYFAAENHALECTLVSNVSLIVCIAPLVTAFLSMIFFPNEKPGWKLFAGAGIALVGVALVVFNGQVVFKLSPIGDLLTAIAATSWAAYCIVLRHLGTRYNAAFITRKVFFYGCITLIPFILLDPWEVDFSVFIRPAVWGNLLFLSVIASMLCFLMWNRAQREIGPVTATNYIYIIPLVGMLTSVLMLDEPANATMVFGSVLILSGVFLGQRR